MQLGSMAKFSEATAGTGVAAVGSIVVGPAPGPGRGRARGHHYASAGAGDLRGVEECVSGAPLYAIGGRSGTGDEKAMPAIEMAAPGYPG